MEIPTGQDFQELGEWGLIENPLAAIEDYSETKRSQRQKNDRHRATKRAYERTNSIHLEDYRESDRPIDRTKWEYLKRRKAWFQPPLGWGRFAAPGTSRILDVGCGDGDQTQRVAEFIAGRWLSAGYDGFPLEIVGIDLNESRIHNARRHTDSPHEKITLKFRQADALDGLGYPDHYFDYVLSMGVFELLDDDQLDTLLEELSRLTAQGMYVCDQLDDYEGLYRRPNLADRLRSWGFEVIDHEKVFGEPFTQSGTEDPMEVWPMDVYQVLSIGIENPPDRSERY